MKIEVFGGDEHITIKRISYKVANMKFSVVPLVTRFSNTGSWGIAIAAATTKPLFQNTIEGYRFVL